MVELTLPKEANIYAAQYELYLPDKKMLQKKLEQWLAEEENGFLKRRNRSEMVHK